MFSVLGKCGDAAPVLSVVEALLAAGSSVNSRDLATGATALHHLAGYSHGQPWAADVARLLRDSGADGRIKNDDGATAASFMSCFWRRRLEGPISAIV
jgi:ankyrin repeat protein